MCIATTRLKRRGPVVSSSCLRVVVARRPDDQEDTEEDLIRLLDPQAADLAAASRDLC